MGVSAAQGSAGLKPGVCTSTTRPSNPFEGQMIYETDTDSTLIWTGSYWQSTAPRENLIINGAMQVTQRLAVGTAVTGLTGTGYNTADRWELSIGTMGTFSQTTIADAPTGSGFRNSLKLQCTTADASPAASDVILFRQKFEGQNLQAIRKGTASAQTVTLSFWVKAFQTGTFIVELEDTDNSRSCSKAYTVNVSNTWEYKTITYPADVTGVLDNDANKSLECTFWLGAGTTFTSGTLATTWASTVSANRAVGVTNLASSTSNNWFMTGASLTIGDADVPFQFKSFADDLRDCQRYYQRIAFGSDTSYANIALGVVVTGGSVLYTTIILPMVLRSIPSAINFSAAATLYVDVVTGGGAATSVAAVLTRSSKTAIVLDVSKSGMTSGQAGTLLQNSTSTAFIDTSAEL